MRLRDKIAIITGATSGIGRSAALLFAKEGAKLVLAGRQEGTGQSVVETIKGNGGEAIYQRTDLTCVDDIQNLVHRAINVYHKIDILYNNAGILPRDSETPMASLSEDSWDRIMEVNLKSVFLTSKYVIPYMIKAGGGSIVNTASTLGIVSRPLRAAYSASKGGIVMLTKAMAMDYASHGIRVNCICPSFVETEMTKHIVEISKKDEKAWREIIAKIPLGRPGKPEDVAYAALFLSSDESKWITGSSLVVDGGFTAH
jgi:NAD(P)-dependent dehydrogenase (short-subunit alcohol dehydrogenase family)